MKWIIHTHGGGRFCDQIITFCHLAAFAHEYGNSVSLVSVDFWKFCELLEDKTVATLAAYPEVHNRKLLTSLLVHLKQRASSGRTSDRVALRGFECILHGFGTARLGPWQSIIAGPNWIHRGVVGEEFEKLNLDEPDISRRLLRKSTVIAGQFITGYSLVEKHRDVLRKRLAPSRLYCERAYNFVSGLRVHFDFLIGVMVRQGDYRDWRGGEYFYPTSRYIQWMKELQERFSGQGRLCFIVASDEPQSLDAFGALPVKFCSGIAGSGGHYLESLIELSMCDCIMSPPSSFGIWASFLGGIPLIPVSRTEQSVKDEPMLTNAFFEAQHHEALRKCIH